MIFPIVESEDRNSRTSGDQNPNGVVDLGLDASDSDLSQENFDKLSKAFFLICRQRSEKGEVRLKHLFPQSGERLLHKPQPLYASPSSQAIDERTEPQREKNRMEKPANNHGRYRRSTSKGEGMIAVSPVPLDGHEHCSWLLAGMGLRLPSSDPL
jgi:hypothetical protein